MSTIRILRASLWYWSCFLALWTASRCCAVDDAVFRFNRSRLQQWQQRCRHEQWKRTSRSRRSRQQQLVTQASLHGSSSSTSGSCIFWGKPSQQKIAQYFWDSGIPRFNNPCAGQLTNPALSFPTHEVALASISSGALDDKNSVKEKGWFPPVPFLGLVGSELQQTDSVQTRYLDQDRGVFQRVAMHAKPWKVLRYQMKVGQGLDCYHRVREAALAWEFDSPDKGIMKCVQPEPRNRTNAGAASSARTQPYFRCIHPLEGTTTSADRTEGWGRRMVSWTKIGPFHVLNPVAVLYEWVDQRGQGREGVSTLYTSCAYATQKGHWLSGEERVTVALRESDDPHTPPPVEVEIISISRAAPSFMGRLAWPFIGRMQDKFFVEELRALHRAGLATSTGESAPTFPR